MNPSEKTGSRRRTLRGLLSAALPALAALAFIAPQAAFAQSPAPSGKAVAADPPPGPNDEVAVVDITIGGEDAGRIVLRFFPDSAPKHVENFKKLARQGFYDGIQFHRVIPGFMIQGGDPNTKTADRATYGQGGPGYSINAEFNPRQHKRGTLSMARTNDPNSAGSQFFLCVADAPFLDNQYTVFGQTLEGMDVADKIVALPRDGGDCPKTPAVMKKVSIVKYSEVAKKGGPGRVAPKGEKVTPKAEKATPK
jgi:peptidyl-prolyl cis-trans isomerase B (cyclophilin B)